MTKVKAAKTVIAHLHAADAELRKAMVTASRAGLKLVVNDVYDSEMCLDDAIGHAEWELPKKFNRGLDNFRKCGKMSSQ